MKNRHFLLVAFLLVFSVSAIAQNKIGDNPAVIQSGSLLELESLSKGLRLPRIPLNDVTKWTLDGTPVSGMLIYNETGSVAKGLYYWSTDAAKWTKVIGNSIGTTPPTGTGTGGDTYYNTTTGDLSYYNAVTNSWVLLTTLTGDVTGTTSANVVSRIQGTAVSPTAPAGGQVLTYNATTFKWEPAAASGITSSAIAPASPTIGETYYNTTNNKMYYYDGTAWLVVATATSGTTSPSNPVVGQTYYNTTDSKFYYYNGTAWVAIDSTLSGATPPTGTATGGTTYYNTTTGDLSYYDAVTNSWISLTTLAGDVTGSISANAVTRIQGTAVSTTAPTTAGQVLTYDGSKWAPATSPTTTVVDNLTSTSATNALSANQGKVLNDALTAETGRATTAEATKVAKTDAFTGDVTGTYNATVVSKLQGTAVSNTAPTTTGQVLTYNSATSAWEPAAGAATTTVVDNLTSTSATNALSANQGKVLNDALTAETGRATTAEATKIAKTDAFTGDVIGTYNATVVSKLQGTAVSNTAPTTTGQVLTYNSTTSAWEPAAGATTTTVVDNLTSTSATNALSANQGKVLNDALTAETGRATTAEATKVAKTDAFTGDVTGTYNATVVSKLQGTAVSNTAPTTTGQVLTYNSATSAWEPAAGAATTTVVDNLTSTSATSALSANQGKILSDALTAETTRATAAEATKEDLTNKSTNITSDTGSDTKYPSVKAVETYVTGKATTVVDNLTSSSTADALSANQGNILNTNKLDKTAAFTGDVTGTYNATVVSKLQGTAVSNTAPTTTGQVLTYNNATSTWEPAAAATTTVVNDLTTGGTASALSAEMGKTLNTTKADVSTTISAGAGLSGGGTLAANRTISLDVNNLTTKSSVADNDLVPIYDNSTSTTKNITRANLLSGLTGAVVYQGTWDAGANSPALADGVSTDKGKYYVVSAVGTQTFNSTSITFNAGDWVVSNGLVWQKVDNFQDVSSVFGRTGSIIAANGDYTASQVTNAPAGNITATTVQGAVNWLDNNKIGLANLSAAPTGGALSYNNATGTFTLPAASGSTDGYLTQGDWNTFNNKVNTARAITTSGTSGLAGGGDLTADRALSMDVSKLSTKSSVSGADLVPIYDATNGTQNITRDNLLSGITGALIYQGVWDANANNPDITGIATKGYYYVANTSGTQTLSGNSITFGIGDWVIYNGTKWEKLINSSTVGVTSFNTRNGAVMPSNNDYSAAMIANTAAGSITSSDVQGALNELDTKKLSSTLNSATIYVGNGSNVATAVALSGDATVDNTGKLTIANDAVTTSKIKDSNVTDAKLDKANIPLSGFGLPTTTVNLGSQQIINLATPISGSDAATKAYVDAAVTAGAVDATTSNKGIIQLSGDLTGTATSPAIAGGAVSTTKIAANAVDYSKLKGISADGSVGQVLATDGSGNLTWANQTAVTPVVDALTSTSTTSALSANQGNVLNTTKEDLVNKSTNITSDTGSDTKYPSVKAVETYVTSKTTTVVNNLSSTSATDALSANQGKILSDALTAETTRATAAEATKEDLTNKSTNITSDTGSDTKYPSVKAVETYVTSKSTTVVDNLTSSSTADALSANQGNILNTNKLDKTAAFTGDVTGTYNATVVSKLQGTAISSTAPTTTGQVLTYNNTTSAWEPAAAATTTVVNDLTTGGTTSALSAEMGKTLSAALTTETGRATTAEATKVAKTDAFTGDVTGTYNATVVSKLQGTAVSNTAPTTTGQVLTYNNATSAWEPAAAATTAVVNDLTTGGTTSALSAEMGKTLDASKLDKTAAFTGDVTGTYNANKVVAIQNVAVSSSAPTTAGQVLTYDGSQWAPATSNNGWSLTGNAGTTAGTNFIGTTDDVDLVFKTNNIRAGVLGSSNSNIAFGVGALNPVTTGSGIIAIGSDALKNNTNGMYHVAIGNGALYSNTTGIQHTAVGAYALYNNTAGQENTALGVNALYGNTTGSTNVAVGSGALQTINTDNNTAVGFASGTKTGAAVDNVTSSNSVYLGAQTRALADGDINEIVIGNNATGLGTNSAIIGNSNVSKYGFRGVGYTFPSAQATASGQVLTNDGSGTLSWSAPANITVVDNLTSTSTTDALSANQGKTLSDALTTETGRATTAEATKVAKTDAFTGDVTGTYNATVVSKLQGTAVSNTAPTTTGQVLTYNNATSAWEPAAAATTTVVNDLTTGGTTSALSAEMGKTLDATKLDKTAAFTGDVTGTYNANKVVAIQNVAVSSTAPTTAGQVLTYDGSQWAPATSNNGWSLTGNAGTTAGTNFIGTTDDVDVVIKRNNAQAGLLSAVSQNTSWGVFALSSNTTGTRNTANGHEALYSNTGGYSNTANGYQALYSNITGSANTADGYQALYSNTAGTGNTAFGYNALADLNITDWTGNNTAIGYSTGFGIVTGVNNTILGANVIGLPAALSNNIIIADGAGNRRINVDASGKMGVGTTAPTQTLSVKGNIGITDDTYYTAFNQGTQSANISYTLPTDQATASGQVLTNNGSGTLSWSAPAATTVVNDLTTGGTTSALSAEMGKTLDAAKLDKTAVFTGDVTGTYNANKVVAIQNVAVSSTAPTTAGQVLTYDGSQWAPATSNNGWSLIGNAGTTAGTNFIGTTDDVDLVFKTNNARAGVLGSSNSNIAFGVGALNPVTTGSGIIAIGSDALKNNTNGMYHVAIGNGALYSNTTGIQHTAVGAYALYSNTAGQENTALGVNALYGNTTGSTNVAVGSGALQTINTDNNTAVGFASGTKTGAAVDNVTSSNSVYLGAQTRALADGDINEIVIGNNATGLGTNSAIIGNSNVSKYGFRGVGYTFPSAQATASGQVLTNDGSGALSWSTPVATPVVNDLTTGGTSSALSAEMGKTLDTNKADKMLTISTPANSGLSGGGDLSANRSLSLDVNNLTTTSAIASSNLVAIYDGSTMKNITRDNFLSGITGALIYQGTWDAGSNSPDITSVTTKGYYYVANTAGTQTLSGSSLTFAVGDWAIYNGTIWEKLTNSTTVGVTQFNGRNGVVNPANNDYSASMIANTAAGTITSTDVQSALNELDANKLGKTAAFTGDVTGTYNATVVSKLQGTVVSSTAPTTTGQVLTYNNTTSAWEPAAAATTAVVNDLTTGGTSSALSAEMGKTLSAALTTETGRATTAEATKVAKTDAFTGDVTGTYNATVVSKLQGTAVSNTAPTTTGQVLTYNNATSAWEPAAAATTAVVNDLTTGGTSSALSAEMGKTLDTNKLDKTAAFTGDVTGTYNANKVVAIQNVAVSSTAPTTAGQVLTYDGSQWAPATSNNGWSLIGNAGTTAGTNFIGTTDDVDLVFKTNNMRAGVLGSSNSNIAFGVGALNPVTTGSGIIAIGSDALKNNTNGMYHVAIGNGALYSNTTGIQHTAVGAYALYSNTTGQENTALGVNALYGNTTGSTNVAVGSGALQTITTDNNTAVGFASGTKTGAAVDNVTSSNSVYLGAQTRALADGDINEIVIGNNATGLGSNSAVIGNSSVSKYGFRGVGYTFPSAQATASGQVLTNDGSGALSWSTPATTTVVNDLTTGGTTSALSAEMGKTLDTNKLDKTATFTGDVTGTYNANKVVAIQNVAVSSSAPTTAGQVLTYDGSQWTPATATSGWSLTGNAGTTAGTNFIGTTDDVSLIFKVNNTPAGSIGNSADNNTAFGLNALAVTSVNTNNSAFGNGALKSNTIGDYNTAVGVDALSTNPSGAHNVAVGWHALLTNTSGSNVALGSLALEQNTTGDRNTAVGTAALGTKTTGNRNTALGYSAGYNLTTGGSNIIIGYGTDVPSATASNQLSIGNSIYGLNIGQANPMIGIGTTAPAQTLSVKGSIGITDDTYYTAFNQGSQSADISYTLPAAQATASGQVLTNDGSGTLSWTAPATTTVVNDLTTGGTTSALSAEMGKTLDAAKLDKTAAFTGDVTGTYNATVVSKLQGTAVSSTAPTTTGQVLTYNNTTSAWEPAAPTATSFKGRIACAGTISQVISDTNVTTTGTIIVSYEDPNDGAVISVAVGSRVANTSFKVLFGAIPPTTSYINYTILP